MLEKEQFDEFLGGSQELPPEVSVAKLASARASEIAAMTYSIENPHQTKLIFQKLPVHMRRRIMSHNAKRMPRRLREAHLRQMAKSGLPPKSKRPSRKYRRRPQNLLLEYNRRQRNKIWLETHIWHAKRFKMTEKWGYKIANRSNDRCFRASYRAVAKHCLIQDISYYSCIEISGPVSILKDTLKRHCNPDALSFGAKVYDNGSREGSLMFFKKDSYPTSPIGTVDFIWKQDNSQTRTLWIWAHPSFYSELLSEIISSFSFELVNCSQEDRPADVPKSRIKYDAVNPKRTEATKLVMRNVHSLQTPKYSNDRSCRMVLLKDSLNRFRLCGPLALAILSDALCLPKLEEEPESCKASEINIKSEVNKMDSDNDVEILGLPEKNTKKSVHFGGISSEDMEVEVMDVQARMVDSVAEDSQTIDASWYKSYYKNRENVEQFRVQKELFEVLRNLKSPSQLPPNIVMALTVLDPRFFIPQKRRKSQKNDRFSENVPMPPTLANRSPIWEPGVRDFVVANLKTTSEVNKLRSGNLVPGIGSDEKYDEDVISKVPVLLIQRPGCSGDQKRLGFSSGVDIILPSGWAMPFWLALIFRCARPGGLRESKSIIFENMKLNSSDINSPDTLAYVREATDTKLQLLESYFRHPPNKRVNFIKLGISSPFLCEWKMLMKDWTDANQFYVLRNRKLLKVLQENISGSGRAFGKRRGKTSIETAQASFDENLFADKNCLVTVRVSVEKKGCPKDFAIICTPLREDLAKFEDSESWSGPVEKLRTDPHEAERKTLRTGHLALLKRLRRQRLRWKKSAAQKRDAVEHKVGARVNLKAIMKNLRNKLPNPNRSIIEQQAQSMKSLYLPKCTAVRHSCDREVMGYVTKGDFSFTESRGIGMGYVTLNALFGLIERRSNIVLIRNTNTRQYRVARLEVLML